MPRLQEKPLDDPPPWVRDLAARMVDNVPQEKPPFGKIDGGYTYLGQFISHDIVPPTISKDNSRKVSGALNLDSLYGDRTFREVAMKDGKFKLSEDGLDVYRDELSHRAIIPEERNEENLIIIQFHVLWQRLHNAIVESGLNTGGLATEEVVVKLFQLIVIEDFLRQVLIEEVYDHCVLAQESYLPFEKTQLPAEFSAAGFRFGHSMVRAEYQLNRVTAVGLEEILAMRKQALPATHYIDWGLFFCNRKKNRSEKIDTWISPQMAQIPQDNLQTVFIHVAERNLMAGLNSRLLLGQRYTNNLLAARRNFKMPPRSFGLTPLGSRRTNALGMSIVELPLWPYLLLEAEIQQSGNRLGALGSLIVAQALRDAVARSKFSVLQSGAYSHDAVLASMGEFGTKIGKVIADHRAANDRNFTMAHLLFLLSKLEASK